MFKMFPFDSIISIVISFLLLGSQEETTQGPLYTTLSSTGDNREEEELCCRSIDSFQFLESFPFFIFMNIVK